MCKIDGWITDKDGGQRRANINKNLGGSVLCEHFCSAEHSWETLQWANIFLTFLKWIKKKKLSWSGILWQNHLFNISSIQGNPTGF